MNDISQPGGPVIDVFVIASGAPKLRIHCLTPMDAIAQIEALKAKAGYPVIVCTANDSTSDLIQRARLADPCVLLVSGGEQADPGADHHCPGIAALISFLAHAATRILAKRSKSEEDRRVFLEILAHRPEDLEYIKLTQYLELIVGIPHAEQPEIVRRLYLSLLLNHLGCRSNSQSWRSTFEHLRNTYYQNGGTDRELGTALTTAGIEYLRSDTDGMSFGSPIGALAF